MDRVFTLLLMLLGSSFIAASHWFVSPLTTDVLWVTGKDSSHLISFYFLDAFLGSNITLAECLSVFAIAGVSLSFLEVENVVSSFMEVILKCRGSD